MKKDLIIDLCKRVINGEVDGSSDEQCVGISCTMDDCPFCSNWNCNLRNKNKRLDIAKKYLRENGVKEDNKTEELSEDERDFVQEIIDEVLKEKNKMEKTFREVIADIKEGEIWESRSKYIRRFADAIQIYHKENGKSTPSMLMSNNDKFKLQRKKYTFQEAFKAFEKGNIDNIESDVSGIKYKKHDAIISMFKMENSDEFSGINNDNAIFSLNEVRGKWYINN